MPLQLTRRRLPCSSIAAAIHLFVVLIAVLIAVLGALGLQRERLDVFRRGQQPVQLHLEIALGAESGGSWPLQLSLEEPRLHS